jgi:hypothetical protein
MFLNTFNYTHALPLTFVRFSCFALRRAHLRERRMLSGSDAAVDNSQVAKRTWVSKSDAWLSRFVTQCCQRAIRHAAFRASHSLRWL